jgi:hypothetical protein
MENRLTIAQCQKKLFQVALKLGVSPKLISTRLLSKEDKQDMLAGLIEDETLECHVQCWMEAGMTNYSEGDSTPYKPPEKLPMSTYRGYGKR